MAQRNEDGTIMQQDYRIKLRVPLFRPQTYEITSKKDGTVDVRVDRFDRVDLTFNLHDEKTCEELIKALEDAKMIMRKKRKKGKKVS